MVQGSAVTPGLHPRFDLGSSPREVARVVHRLQRFLFLTHGLRLHRASRDVTYHYFLARFPEPLASLFGIDNREVLILVSNYPQYHARILRALKKISTSDEYRDRVDPYHAILITADKRTTEEVQIAQQQDPELPIIAHLHVTSLDSILAERDLADLLARSFHARNLFDMREPLRTDLYFFGRHKERQELLTASNAGKILGLYGLRKSGKTSLLYNFAHSARKSGTKVIYIDCQNPDYYQHRWNSLLGILASKIAKDIGKAISENIEFRSTPECGPKAFFDVLMKAIRRNPLCLCFDEIERLLPSSGAEAHWRNDRDALHFWRAIRAAHNEANRKAKKPFSIILSGTNGSASEAPSLCGEDNPLYQIARSVYLGPLDYDDFAHMVSRLGRLSGADFSPDATRLIYDTFGGHAFLCRMYCAYLVDRIQNEDRPQAEINKKYCEQALDDFIRYHMRDYVEMILHTLRQSYQDDAAALEILACDGKEAFLEVVEERIQRRLYEYGLLKSLEDPNLALPIDWRHLKKRRATTLGKSTTRNEGDVDVLEWLGKYSEERNKLELMLRSLVRACFLSHFSREQVEQMVREALPHRKDLKDRDLDDMLGKRGLYFSDLIKLVDMKWEYLRPLREACSSKNQLINCLREINQRRYDAHAEIPSEHDRSLATSYVGSALNIVSKALSEMGMIG